jgi:alpha-L-arabinofuranosidase
MFDSSREGKGVPYLDAVVSRSADHKQIFIKAVNTHQSKLISIRITTSGMRVKSTANIETLTADSLAMANSFSTPDAVMIRPASIVAGQSFAIELPKHSISVITLNVEQE